MDDLDRIDGLYVGQLSPYEIKILDRAVEDGEAKYSFEGTAGFLGLAKVRLTRSRNVTYPYT